MAWTTIDTAQYARLLEGLPPALAAVADGLQMPPAEAARAIAHHDGDATTAPPQGHRYVIVDGDLTLFGRLNLFGQMAESEDGNTVLIVTGNLHCTDLIQTPGGVILVGGDLVVSRVFETSFGDSLCTVCGDVRVRFYHGLDVWIEFGGRCEIDTGWGYGLPIGYTDAAAQAVYPRHRNGALYDQFDIPPGETWERADAFVTMMLEN